MHLEKSKPIDVYMHYYHHAVSLLSSLQGVSSLSGGAAIPKLGTEREAH